ncbi:MAG: gliding motility-associated-like protein [Crocinitomix sp.]|jgi:gliding motility-associated-like protein
MRLRIIYTILILPLFLLFSTSGNSQIAHPSNTGVTGYGEDPLEWFEIIGTPDVSNNYGWMGASPWSYPVENPPNGHTTWVTGWSSEKSGTWIDELVLGVEYELSFYMAETWSSSGGGGFEWWTDGTLEVELGDSTYFFEFEGGADFSWYLITITFIATDESMLLTFRNEIAPVYHLWNVSFDGIVDYACDTLDTYISATEVCLGDEVTLAGTSLNDGMVTWDGGIIDGEPFIPAIGTHLYTAMSDFEGDCNRTVEVIVYEYPEFEIVPTAEAICEGDSVIFTVDGADGGIYDWTPDIVIGYPYFPGIGTTDVALSITNGVCEAIETIEITVHEAPIVNALVDDSTVCLGESVFLTGEGAHLYTWNLDITDGSPFTPIVAGIFTCIVEGTDTVSGCSSSDFVTVNILDSPTIEANADDDQVCEGDLITLTGSGSSTYVWDLGITDGVAFEPPIGTTIYTVIGTNENGCEGIATITITVIDCDAIYAGFILPNAVCSNACFSIQDTTVGEVTEWFWDFGPAFEPNTSTLQNPIICSNTPGIYTITLTATNDVGETSTHNEEIIVLEKPLIEVNNDTIIEFGGSVNLIANSLSLGDFTWTPSYLVDCPECPTNTVSPNQTQTYTVQLIDANGCKTSDSVIVMVNFGLRIGVPTAFSPNNDGYNDLLFVKGDGIDSIHFSVYNRYGQLIFETTDQALGWDGNFLNETLNPGVFTWVLLYSAKEGEKIKRSGNTTLIR